MARVTEFTRQVFLDRAQPSNIDAAFSINGGNKAQQLRMDADQMRSSGDKAGAFGKQILQQREIQGQLKAQERFNDFQRTKTEYYNDQKNQRMTKPDNFADDFDDWIRLNAGEIEDSLQTQETDEPFDLDYFRQLVDRDRTSTYEQSTNWENGMRVQNITVGTEQNLDQMNVNFSLKGPRLSDLPAQMNEMRDYVTKVGANVFSPEENQRLFAYGTNQASAAVFDTMLEQDPKSLRNVMLYGNATKDQLIEFVFDIEGRDKIAQEPDGAIAKYGINSKHNGLTHEQVKALTPETAREILATKYWDPRLDKMDPEFKAVAFDAIVNHGNDKDTWKMITEAKGDPYALINARQEYYQRLISIDPEKYGQYKNGWDARMQEMSGYVKSLEAGGRDFLAYSGMVDPDIINRTRNAIPGAIEARQRQDDAIQKQKLSLYNTSYKETFTTMTTALEPIGQEEINKVKQLAINSGDETAIAQASALENTRPFVNQLKGMGEEQLGSTIRKISAEVNKGPTAENRMMLEIAEGVLKNQIESVKNEGLGYWGRIGQIKMPQDINYADQQGASYELRSREDSSLAVYQKTGKLMPVLTPNEISGLKEQFDTLPANEMAGVLSTFDNLDQVSKSNLAKAIDEKSPMLATVISIDDLDTRRRILFGAKIEPKYLPNDMKASIASMLDPMVADPKFKESAAESVAAWYNAVAQENRDFSEGIDEKRVRAGIEAIYGPIVDVSFGGTNEIFNFKDPQTGDFVPEDDLYDMINGIDDGQIISMLGELPQGAMGETVTSDDIRRNGRIISAGDGLYNVVFDNIGGLYDRKGNLVEIDGRKLLELYKKGKK